MTRTAAFTSAVVASALLCAVNFVQQPRAVHAEQAPITFSRQIAPIIYKNCSACHHTGGAGPFPLTSYAQVKRWGSTIQSVTQSRYMPPWLPEPGFGDFADSRRLSSEDIQLLSLWVAAGMPEGDPAQAPAAPVYSSAWQLGTPDLILTVDSPMLVPASGTDLFRNFILPIPIDSTRYIRAMEIKPGSPTVVHHANVLIDRTASLRRLHPDDWQQGIPGMDISIDAGHTFDPDSHFLFWKPDSSALVEPATMPWRLDPGNDLILNMHLKPTGKPEPVQATIGLYFSPIPATRQPMLLQLEHDEVLDIPAGNSAFVVEDHMQVPIDLDVLAVYPHAHYLGKQMKGYAVLPNGQRRWLIYIKDWDINRQSVYRFAAPVFLPKGSVLHMQYTYDNSAANPRNPNSPPLRVRSGNRSVDEMGHLWLQVLPRAVPPASAKSTSLNPDPRLALERVWMQNRLRKDPSDVTALYNLASLESAANHPAAAAALYQRALAPHSGVDPNTPRTHTALGSAYEAQGEWQKAQDQYTAALAIDPANPDARFNLAQLHLRQQHFSEAEPLFQSLVAANPKDTGARIGLGEVFLSTQRPVQATEQFEAVLGLDPANFDALYNLATLALDAGRHSQAAALFEQALKVKDDPDAHRLLAVSYANLNRLPDAATQLRALARLQPADPATHRALAQIYTQMGRLPDALLEQNIVTTAQNRNPDDWNDLGAIYALAGDKNAARRAFERALALDPQHAAARANLGRL